MTESFQNEGDHSHETEAVLSGLMLRAGLRGCDLLSCENLAAHMTLECSFIH